MPTDIHAHKSSTHTHKSRTHTHKSHTHAHKLRLHLTIHTIMHAHTHRYKSTHTHTFWILCVLSSPSISPYLQLWLRKEHFFISHKNLSFFCSNIETSCIFFRSMTRSRTVREKGKNKKNNSLAFYQFRAAGLRATRCLYRSSKDSR